jgi:lipopolysaccharide transport system permease protein
LLPWTYFSEALSRSSISLVGDAQLIRKVYFPRLIMPLAAVVSPAVDCLLSFLLLLVLMAWYGFSPTWGLIMLPVFLVLGLVTALAVGLWLSALNVRYRDVRHTIPFLTQCWLYASPVAYPVSVVPEGWRTLYALNPMVGVIEGFRWALLGQASPNVNVMLASLIAVIGLLVGGLLFFHRMEQTFADVI